MLLIDAIYIHESGGKILLEYLLESLKQSGLPFFLLADERFESPCADTIPEKRVMRLKASEANRRNFYIQSNISFNVIFCFANVPPPLPLKDQQVFVFFQNTLMFSRLFEKNAIGFANKMNYFLKREYIKYKDRVSFRWIVQTELVKERLSERMKIRKERITVLPFYRQEFNVKVSARTKASFLYVADGVAQKNHSILLEAWEYLFTHYSAVPALHLTIPARFDKLLKRINSLNKQGLNIINHGRISRNQLETMYSETEYLVFPSTAESFGLPLIEAASHGCGIIAADLPYVYQVVQPNAVFDPQDHISIADIIYKQLHQSFQPARVMAANRINELLELISP